MKTTMNGTETYDISISSSDNTFQSVLKTEWDGNFCLKSDLHGNPYPDEEVMDLIIYAILEGNILEDTLYICSQGLAWKDTYEDDDGTVERILKFVASQRLN